MSNHPYQEISYLCHDARVSAVLTAVQHYCKIYAGLKHSRGEPFEFLLEIADAISQILEENNTVSTDKK